MALIIENNIYPAVESFENMSDTDKDILKKSLAFNISLYISTHNYICENEIIDSEFLKEKAKDINIHYDLYIDKFIFPSLTKFSKLDSAERITYIKKLTKLSRQY